jgi:hypothetical protein
VFFFVKPIHRRRVLAFMPLFGRNVAILSVCLSTTVLGACVEADVEGEDVEIAQDQAALTSYPGEGGKLNLWDDTGYQDTRLARSDHDANLGDNGFNDKASSYVNKTDYYWGVYEDDTYGGRVACIRPRSHSSNLKDYKLDPSCDGLFCASWGDRISSIRKEGQNGCFNSNARVIGISN